MSPPLRPMLQMEAGHSAQGVAVHHKRRLQQRQTFMYFCQTHVPSLPAVGSLSRYVPIWGDDLTKKQHFFEISKYTALGVNERAHQPSNRKLGFLRLIETLGPLTLLSLQPRSLVMCLDFRDQPLSLSQGLVRDWTQKSAFKLDFQVIFFLASTCKNL